MKILNRQLLTSNAITLSQRQSLIRYNKIPETLRPYLSTWDNTYFELSEKVTVFNEEYYAMKQPA